MLLSILVNASTVLDSINSIKALCLNEKKFQVFLCKKSAEDNINPQSNHASLLLNTMPHLAILTDLYIQTWSLQIPNTVVMLNTSNMQEHFMDFYNFLSTKYCCECVFSLKIIKHTFSYTQSIQGRVCELFYKYKKRSKEGRSANPWKHYHEWNTMSLLTALLVGQSHCAFPWKSIINFKLSTRFITIIFHSVSFLSFRVFSFYLSFSASLILVYSCVCWGIFHSFQTLFLLLQTSNSFIYITFKLPKNSSAKF